jgi:hypothetical protein
MQTGSANLAYKFLARTLFAELPAEPVLGEPDAVGAHLVRVTEDPPGEDDFGLYLGMHRGQHVVAIKDFDAAPSAMSLTGCEIFSDVDELRSSWLLD